MSAPSAGPSEPPETSMSLSEVLRSHLWLPLEDAWLRSSDPLGILDSIMGSHAFLAHLSSDPPPPPAEVASTLSVFLPFVKAIMRPLASTQTGGPFQDNGGGRERDVIELDGDASVTESLIGAKTVKKAIWFLCEHVQHARFAVEVQRAAMSEGLKVLDKAQDILSTYPAEHSARLSVDSLFDIHSTTLSALACGVADYRDSSWNSCRQQARRVVSRALSDDSAAISNSITRLGKIFSDKRSSRPRSDGLPLMPIPVRIRANLWPKVYDNIRSTDLEGTAMLIQAARQIGHLDVLEVDKKGAWDIERLQHAEQRRQSRKTADDFNRALTVAKGDRFAGMLERFANANAPAKLVELWNMPNVTASATFLFLSPLEDIHNAVQSLVQETFDDVNDRADCFRALLKAMPQEGLQGLTDFLGTFIEAALTFPEANSMAKWMVLCLTDVVDVLCRGSRSLFRDEAFINHTNVRKSIPKLWRWMSRCLSLLFHYTPQWAEFFAAEAMTVWMRDALIFARSMIEQTRTFEGAATNGLKSLSGESWREDRSSSPVKIGVVGKQMVETLKQVLVELVIWLRLTDIEILYQAFELIKLLLDRFHRSDVAPGQGVIANDRDDPLVKLTKFIQRKQGYRCKLGDSELAELSELVDRWDKFDEDVIQYEGEEITFEGEVKKLKATTTTKGSTAQRSTAASGSSSRAPSDDEFGDDIMVLSDSDLRRIDAISRKATGSSTLPLKLKQTTLKPVSMPRPSMLNSSLSSISRPVSSVSSSSSKMSFGSTKASMKPSKSKAQTQAMKNLRSEFKSTVAAPKSTVAPPKSTVAPPKAGLKSGFALSSKPISEVEPPRRKRWQDTGSSGASSDASDTDEESESRGLAGLTKSAASRPTEQPRKPVALPRRSIKLTGDDIAIRNPQQIRRDQREATRRTKMRLKPDMEDLHRHLLRWDTDTSGDRPPELADTRFRPIPDTFSSPEEYLAVLQPLFMLEAWAQLQKGIEDNQNETRVIFDVLGRSVVDEWVDVEVVVPSGQIDQRYRLSDVDVVLVTGLNHEAQPDSSYARVMVFKKTFQDIQITLRFHNSRKLAGFSARSKWRLQKIMNLSTIHREWASLKGMPYFDTILPAVLKAKSHPIVQVSSYDVKDAMRSFSVNDPQARAILGAMNPNAQGFVLIQGPPGTGKTKTIGGLVGKFLSDRASPSVNLNTNRDGTMSSGGQVQPSAKILICAPSNAAIDEVCRRLKEGLRLTNGTTMIPNVVRMGHEDSMNIAVKDVSLDELIDQKLKDMPTNKKSEGADEIAQIRQELDALQLARNDYQEQLRMVSDDPSKSRLVEEELRRIGSKRSSLTQMLNKTKDQQRDSSRALDAARRKARYEVIFEADIICSTLSGAGHDLLSDCDFETVIIDEAAQAVELSALIPLKYNCKRCIMVGDPNQLPPTVLSRKAEDFKYSESMFVRIQRQAPQNVHLLSIQYRMHPDISVLPSRVFYDGKLADGPDMAAKTLQPWHSAPVFAPYRFFNVDAGRESAGSIGHSLKNTAEANAALAIYQNLKMKFPAVDFDYRIGIVTMYKEQKRELIRVFSSRYGRNITSTVDFNTVDGFQGQEKDIIILSCVRAGGLSAGVGFLKDTRRMNVALTRAKSSLFILGHAPTLEGGGPQWNGIVLDARERNAMMTYSPQVFNFAPSIATSSYATQPLSIYDVVPRNPYLKPPANPPTLSSSTSKRPSTTDAGPPAKVARLSDAGRSSANQTEDLKRMMEDDFDPYSNRGAPSPSPPRSALPAAIKSEPVASTPAAPSRPSSWSKPLVTHPLSSGAKGKIPSTGGLRPPPKPPGTKPALPTGQAPAAAVQHLLKKPPPTKLSLGKKPAPKLKQDSMFVPTKRKAPSTSAGAAGSSGPKPPAMSARERLNLSAKQEDPSSLSSLSKRPPPPRR